MENRPSPFAGQDKVLPGRTPSVPSGNAFDTLSILIKADTNRDSETAAAFAIKERLAPKAYPCLDFISWPKRMVP
jgi:hypothetical protein